MKNRTRLFQRAIFISVVLVLLFSALPMMPGSTGAFASTPVLDQSYEPASITLSMGRLDKAQTFTVGITGTLVRVDVDINRWAGVEADLLFDIRPTTGGVPVEDDAAALVSVRVPASQVPTTDPPEGFFTIDLSSFAVQVTAGQVLAIVLRSDPDIWSYTWHGTGSGDGYPQGELYFRDPEYGWPRPTWYPEAPGKDFAFRTYVAPPTSELSPPEDIALNPTGTGSPSPLESDPGWGGGVQPWEIIDGIRTYPEWQRGLAFTYASPGNDWRQATIDFGEPRTFNRVMVWHHGLEHVPNTYKIQYWDGTNWVDIFSTTNGHDYLKYPVDTPQNWWEGWSTPTENIFDAVTSTKVRFAFYNGDITHGWIYEFEVYNDQVETGGSISGHVYESGGTPISGAEVLAFDFAQQYPLQAPPVGQATTDADGYYSIGGLSAGNYLVSAVAAGHERRSYPNASGWEGAQPVPVAAGLETPGIDFSLGPGGSISGTITDQATGLPLSQVSVYCVLASQTQGPGVAVTLTDDSGNYVLEGLPYGSYCVAAPIFRMGSGDDSYIMELWQEKTLAEQSDALEVAEGISPTGINFTLSAGGTISGTVYQQDGTTPIEGVTVAAFEYSTLSGGWIPLGAGMTDAQGLYTTSGLPAGDYAVLAQATGYIREWYDGALSSDQAAPVTVTVPGDTPNIDFRLDRGGTISGHVYQSDGSTPVVGAQVQVFDYSSLSGSWIGIVGAQTAADGSYTTSGLPAGDYGVRVVAAGYAVEWYNGTFFANEASPVTVTPPGDTPNIDFTMELAASVQGTVTDQATGSAVVDASVGGIDLSPGWHSFVYRFEEGWGGSIARAAFQAPGDAQWRSFSTSELDIRTSAPDGQSGILLTTKKNTWDDRHPSSHFELVQCVDVDSTEEPGWYGQSVVTAVNQSENIHGNDDNFTSYYEAYFYVETAGTWRFSTDSDDASEIVIDDQVVAYWYEGHGAANQWEYKARVHIMDYESGKQLTSVSAGADGSYTIGGLPPGTYWLQARASGYIGEYFQETRQQSAATPVTLSAGETRQNISFTLERGGTISGTVTDQITGAPLANVSVEAKRVVGGEGGGSTTTDQYGNYTITNLPYGGYHVSSPSGKRWGSGDDGYLTEYWQEVSGPPSPTPIVTLDSDNPDRTDINFTLEVGGTISGYVYDDLGNPIPGAYVDASVYETGQGKWHVETDTTGYYQIPSLATGNYRVSAWALDRAREYWQDTFAHHLATPVEVTAPSDTPNIDFSLEPGGTISGTVTDQVTGLPLANISVDCGRVDGDGSAGATIDQYGNYTITNLPFGQYRVGSPSDKRWGSGDGNYAREYYNDQTSASSADLVTISAGAPDATGVNFSLEEGGAISGVIRNADGSAVLGDISVEARRAIDDPKEWYTATADSQGSYTIQGLPYGDYIVRSPGGGRWGAGDDNLIMEYYENQTGEGTASPVTVADGVNPSGIDFTLDVGGSISGIVTDESQQPIYNLHVYATDSVTSEWKSGANTDAQGNYALRGLPEGGYLIRTYSQNQYMDEWFDNTYIFQMATAVPVTPNVNTPDINFALEAVVVRGTLGEAIADGVAWLASQQNPDGSWGTSFQIAKTALAVLKLETHAKDVGISPLDPGYPYSGAVQSGLDYLFTHAYTTNVTMQGARNPDVNGNGIGVYFHSPVYPDGKSHDYDIYETAMSLMAIGASTAPASVVNVTGSPVHGWSYAQVAQDAVDYLAWGQTDSGYGRGGWNYMPMSNQGDRSDQSNSGWVTLGLMYAEDFGSVIPGFVRSELNIWIDYVQDDVNGDDNDGGSYYSVPGEDQQVPWANMLRTGNLLQQMAFVGDTPATPRVQDAVDFLVRHWGENADSGWRGYPTCYQTTYTVMKGLEALGIETIDSIDWFGNFTGAIMGEQSGGGWFPPSRHDDGERILSTEWALLTLEKAVPPTREAPDLTVIEKHEEWVDEGAGTYNVYFTIQNKGNVNSGSQVAIRVTIDDQDVNQIGDPPLPSPEPCPSLEPGASFSSVIGPVTLSDVEDTITVTVDPDNELMNELNEDNNLLTNRWPPRPDLIIAKKGEWWITPSAGTYKVKYMVQNVGNCVIPAGHFAGLIVDGNPVEQKAVPQPLAPGEFYWDEFTSTLTLEGDADTVAVVADATNSVPEVDEANNEFSNIWKSAFWTLIEDPTGDQMPADGPDITRVDGFRWPELVGFRVVYDFTSDGVWGHTFIDADQDPATGFAINDIGAEYMFKVNIGGTPEGELFTWSGSDWVSAGTVPVAKGTGAFAFELQLSLLGNDEGNMDVVQEIGAVAAGSIVSDVAPDTGYCSFGEPAWIEIITDPAGDQVPPEGPDITGIDYAWKPGGEGYSAGVFLRIRADNLDLGNLHSKLFLDIDQDPATGHPEMGGIGAEYAVVVTTSGASLEGKLHHWSGSEWQDFGGIGVFRGAGYYWFGLNLGQLGGDDGNMDIVQGIGRLSPQEMTDAAPDSGYASLSPVLRLRLQSNMQTTTPQWQALQELKQIVEDKSGGAITIDIYAPGELVPTPDALSAASAGVIDMFLTLDTYHAGQYPALQYATVPGLIRNIPRDYNPILYFGVYGVNEAMLGTDNIRLLEMWRMGQMALAMRGGQVTMPVDLASKKIRVMGGAAMQFVTLAGGVPVMLPMGEVYAALQTGVIDGVLTTPYAISAFKLYEQAPYITALGSALGTYSNVLGMNMQRFNELPPDYQQLLLDVSQYVARQIWPGLGKGSEDSAIAGLKAAGSSFVSLSPEQVESWQGLGREAVTMWYTGEAGATGQQIVDLINAYYQWYASSVHLSLQPPYTVVAVGETFEVAIQAEAGANLVSGVEAFIDFDPTRLEVVDTDDVRTGIQIMPGSSLPNVLRNSADNTEGTINFTAGKLGEPFPSGTFTVATIRFRARETTSGTGVSFSFAEPRKTLVDFGGDPITGLHSNAKVEIVSGATVDISVVLQGGARPESGWVVPLTVRFFSPGANVTTDTPLYTFDLTTAKSGSTAVARCTGITPDTYDITAVSPHTLLNVRRDVVISVPTASVSMGKLLEGDANDSGIINMSDFGILAMAYGRQSGQPGFDARADFDRSGRINISDFGLLSVNYLKTAPVTVP